MNGSMQPSAGVIRSSFRLSYASRSSSTPVAAPPPAAPPPKLIDVLHVSGCGPLFRSSVSIVRVSPANSDPKNSDCTGSRSWHSTSSVVCPTKVPDTSTIFSVDGSGLESKPPALLIVTRLESWTAAVSVSSSSSSPCLHSQFRTRTIPRKTPISRPFASTLTLTVSRGTSLPRCGVTLMAAREAPGATPELASSTFTTNVPGLAPELCTSTTLTLQELLRYYSTVGHRWRELPLLALKIGRRWHRCWLDE
ncbi:hypothetical protein PF004_g18371 [Phytophthora fragariae]|uniref:Uncharacterized protein n=1 Tax=Phytophthora fragariae TaxID=53985 RepID=A0A6G0NCP7_9STRA|nr:hypothetical protein PF004_g18371 [Phytophthora fragariae]